MGLNCRAFSAAMRGRIFFLLKVETFSRTTVVQEMALKEKFSKSEKLQYNNDDLNQLIVPFYFGGLIV